MKKSVFISHSSADKERFVREFARRLEMEGISVWYDDWEIKPGDSLTQKLFQEGLGKAKALIAVISKNSIKSKWVQEELNRASYKRVGGKFRVIPIILDDCPIPESVKGLVWIKISDLSNYEDVFTKIVSTLKGEDRWPLERFTTTKDKERAEYAKIRDEVNRLIDLEKVSYVKHLTPISLKEQLEACSVGMNDLNWNIRFRNISLATALISTQVGYSLPIELVEDEWLFPNTNVPLHFPWVLAIEMIFAEAAQFERIMKARAQILSNPNSFLSKLEEKEHFVLNLLQGVRASLVAIDNTKGIRNQNWVSQVWERFPLILEWIGYEHFANLQPNESGVRTRLLLSWSDLTQIEQFFTRNFANHEAITSIIAVMLSQIQMRLTDEQRGKGAVPLRIAASEAPRLWENEMGSLHNQGTYPLGAEEANPRIRAILQFLDICVRTRSEYSGIGWETWREVLMAFGEESKYRQLRELAKFAEKRINVTPFSSR